MARKRDRGADDAAAPAAGDPLGLVDDVPGQDNRRAAVALEERRQDAAGAGPAACRRRSRCCSCPPVCTPLTIAGLSNQRKSSSTKMTFIPSAAAVSRAASMSANRRSSGPRGVPAGLKRMPARPSQKRNQRTHADAHSLQLPEMAAQLVLRFGFCPSRRPGSRRWRRSRRRSAARAGWPPRGRAGRAPWTRKSGAGRDLGMDAEKSAQGAAAAQPEKVQHFQEPAHRPIVEEPPRRGKGMPGRQPLNKSGPSATMRP